MNEEKVPLIEFPMKSYEYTLGNISASQDNYEYWSPPLPTAIDMYWQLNFMSVNYLFFFLSLNKKFLT